MKKNRFYRITIFTITIVIVYFLYKYYSTDSSESMSHLPHAPITVNENERIHFYSDGFAVSGSFTRFYDHDGTPIASPFSNEISPTTQYKINMSTSNFMLVDEKAIYKTSVTPFEKIYELNEAVGYGIREFADYILILVKDESNIIIPKIYDLQNNVLSDFNELNSLYYMDSDYEAESKSLSVLALSLDASFPSSKVFNYMSGGNTLYSVVSVDNQSFFRLLRLPSNVILVGTHEIICYNIDGSIQWSIKNKNIKNCTIMEVDDGFVIYFLFKIDNNDDGVFFNALSISSDGSYKKLNFPLNLVNLQPYGKGYIGLRYGRNIIVLDKDGTIQQEYHVSEDIISLYCNEHYEKNIYLLDRDNQLHIYSTKREDSQK